jgi:hypothetical protein
MTARMPLRPDVNANVVINGAMVNTVDDDQIKLRITF